MDYVDKAIVKCAGISTVKVKVDLFTKFLSKLLGNTHNSDVQLDDKIEGGVECCYIQSSNHFNWKIIHPIKAFRHHPITKLFVCNKVMFHPALHL